MLISLSLYIHTHIYIHTHTHIHIYVYTHIYTHIYARVKPEYGDISAIRSSNYSIYASHPREADQVVEAPTPQLGVVIVLYASHPYVFNRDSLIPVAQPHEYEYRIPPG